MNEDYLWDKSGEPDPEIERLEKSLGSLRFKRPAAPLPLPASSRRSFRYSYTQMSLAAAAVLLLLLMAGGLWLALHRTGSSGVKQKLAESNAPAVKTVEQDVASGPRPPLGSGNPADDKLTADLKKPVVAPEANAPRHRSSRSVSGARLLTARTRNVRTQPNRAELAREGEQAKAQLIMALHIASDKLNEVQRKIHANPGT